MKHKILKVFLVLITLYACIATVLMDHKAQKAIQEKQRIRKLIQDNQRLESEVEMYIKITNNI